MSNSNIKFDEHLKNLTKTIKETEDQITSATEENSDVTVLNVLDLLIANKPLQESTIEALTLHRNYTNAFLECVQKDVNSADEAIVKLTEMRMLSEEQVFNLKDFVFNKSLPELELELLKGFLVKTNNTLKSISKDLEELKSLNEHKHPLQMLLDAFFSNMDDEE